MHWIVFVVTVQLVLLAPRFAGRCSLSSVRVQSVRVRGAVFHREPVLSLRAADLGQGLASSVLPQIQGPGRQRGPLHLEMGK